MTGEIDRPIFEMSQRDFKNLTWTFNHKNLGISSHVPQAVSKVLLQFQNVIVIEDDVRIEANALRSAISILEEGLPAKCFTVGFMSGIPSISFLEKVSRQNYWRKCEYFSSWGWGTSSDAWKNYMHKLPFEIESKLENSIIWRKKNKYSQRLWIRRFKKVQSPPLLTWDYQMQYVTYAKSLYHLAPVFRAADNKGFESNKSTNTKGRKPRFLKGKVCELEILPAPKLKVLKATSFFDKITWAGDSKLMSIYQKFKFNKVDEDKKKNHTVHLV